MLAAEVYEPRRVRVHQVPVPKWGPDDALLRIQVCGICGSDVHRYLMDAYGSRFRYPLNSGHEFAAQVVSVGERVTNISPDQRVTGHPQWVQFGGAFAEYLLVPEADRNLISVEGSGKANKCSVIEQDLVTLIEPLTVALQALDRSEAIIPTNVKSHPKLVILGSGTIGLSVLLAAQTRGYNHIVVSEPSPLRREIAESIGAITVDPSGPEGVDRLRSAVSKCPGKAGNGADIVFECAGTADSVTQAVEISALQSQLIMVALTRTKLGIDVIKVVTKKLTVKGTIGAPLHKYAIEAARILRSRNKDAAKLITHRFPLEDAEKAFELASDPHKCCKVLVEPLNC